MSWDERVWVSGGWARSRRQRGEWARDSRGEREIVVEDEMRVDGEEEGGRSAKSG